MGNTGCVEVTVWVTVLVDVATVVLVLVLVEVLVRVDGASVVVVVVGASEVVVGASVVLEGDWVTVCVVPPGPGTTDAEGVDVPEVAVDDVVDVPAGLLSPLPVNFTIAYTRKASTTAVSTPRPTSAAGLRYHGVGSGGGDCP